MPSGNPPTAAVDYLAVHQGQVLIAHPVANDTDLEYDSLTPTITTGASFGYAYFDANNQFIYLPNAGYVGPDVVAYRVNDGTNDSNIVNINITVTNIQPVVNDDEYDVHQGESITVNPMSNDSDGDFDAFGPSLVTGASNGYAYFDASNLLVYSPNAGYIGDEIITYHTYDGGEYSEPATITIHVTNIKPVANDDEYDVHQGQSITVNPMSNDSDGDLDNFWPSLVTGASNGYAYFDSNNMLVYTPNAGYVGDEIISYHTYDGGEFSDPAIITIHVTNIKPVANDDEYDVHQGQSITVNPMSNDSDGDLDNFWPSLVTGASNGYAYFDSNNQLVYTPNAGYVGDEIISYHTYDGGEFSEPAIITIHVTNAKPYLLPASFSITRDTSIVNATLIGFDDDFDPLTYRLLGNAQRGIASLSPDGTLNYTPTSHFVGQDQITVVANDGAEDGQPMSFVIDVTSNAGDVLLANIGNGNLLVSTILSPSPSLVYGGDLAAFDPSDAQLSIRLLTSGESYNLITNGSFGNIDADGGVSGVSVIVDTKTPIGDAPVGTGDVGTVYLPTGNSTFGPSQLSVYSRGDLGGVVADESTGGAMGGSFEFGNLTGSFLGFDHVQNISALGWFGDTTDDLVQVRHGVENIQAFGIKANAVLNSAYDTLDMDTAVSIGNGGIATILDVENVSNFSSSGDIGTISLGTLKGDFTLAGTLAVDTFVLASAQDNAGIQASQATFRILRTPAFGLDERFVRFNGWRWNFAQDVNIGTIQVFQTGLFPIDAFTEAPGVDTFYRLKFEQNLNIGYCEFFNVWGSLRVLGNITLGAAYSIQVSGISVSRLGGVEDITNAIEVGNRFDIGRFIHDNMRLTQASFVAYRSVVIPRFRAVQRGVTSFVVGASAWPGAREFTGTIRFDDGDVAEMKIKGALIPHNPLPADLVYINGHLNEFECKGIGTNSWGIHPRVFANSIGTIRSGSFSTMMQPIPVIGLIAANIQATSSIGTITVVGNITGDVTVEAGDIEEINVGAMTGNIFVTGGNLRRLRASALQGSIDVQRDRTDRNSNIGGNIWRINVTGNISSTLIHADNAIAEITAGTVSNSVRFILQAPGEIVTTDDGEAIRVSGVALNITIANGAFRPHSVLFTHYLMSLSNFTAPFDNSAAVAWKIPLRYYYRLLLITDRDAGAGRVVLWTVVMNDANGSAIPEQVLFTDNVPERRLTPSLTTVVGTAITVEDNID